MNNEVLSGLNQSELDRRVEELRRELLNLRIQQRVGSLENSSRIRSARREIARCLTIRRKNS